MYSPEVRLIKYHISQLQSPERKKSMIYICIRCLTVVYAHSLLFLVIFKNWGLSSVVVIIKHGYVNIFTIKRKHNIPWNFWTKLVGFRQFGSQSFYSAFLWNSHGMNTWLTTRIMSALEVLQNPSCFFKFSNCMVENSYINT